ARTSSTNSETIKPFLPARNSPRISSTVVGSTRGQRHHQVVPSTQRLLVVHRQPRHPNGNPFIHLAIVVAHGRANYPAVSLRLGDKPAKKRRLEIADIEVFRPHQVLQRRRNSLWVERLALIDTPGQLIILIPDDRARKTGDAVVVLI